MRPYTIKLGGERQITIDLDHVLVATSPYAYPDGKVGFTVLLAFQDKKFDIEDWNKPLPLPSCQNSFSPKEWADVRHAHMNECLVAHGTYIKKIFDDFVAAWTAGRAT